MRHIIAACGCILLLSACTDSYAPRPGWDKGHKTDPNVEERQGDRD